MPENTVQECMSKSVRAKHLEIFKHLGYSSRICGEIIFPKL